MRYELIRDEKTGKALAIACWEIVEKPKLVPPKPHARPGVSLALYQPRRRVVGRQPTTRLPEAVEVGGGSPACSSGPRGGGKRGQDPDGAARLTLRRRRVYERIG